ncbi:cytochrome D1 domain-containing protein, partial [Candidatus Latescibacterota bacterium]
YVLKFNALWKVFFTALYISFVLWGCAKSLKIETGGQTEPSYSSPIEIITDSNNTTIYIAEKTANRIAVFDIETSGIVKHFHLPCSPSGLALGADERLLYVTCSSPDGKIYIIDIAKAGIRKEISVGHSPCSPAVSPDGRTLYVCNRFDNTVSAVNLRSNKVVRNIKVLREPTATAVTPDGKYLFVANFLPIGPMPGDYTATFITVIDAEKNKALKNIQLIYGATGVRDLSISPDGKFLYATHTLAQYKVPTTDIESGKMNSSVMTIIDTVNLNRVNTVPLDDAELGAANPWGIECSGDGKYIFIAHSGTHEISVIDRIALHERLSDPAKSKNIFSGDFSFLSGIRKRIDIDGIGPRGLAVSGDKLFAAEYFSNSLGILDMSLSGNPRIQSISLGGKKEITTVRIGEMLFHDASLCYQKWQSCTSCHPQDGRSDALNWDLLNDGTGNPKSTKSLLLSHKTPPVMVTGIRASAEVAVRAGFKFIQFAEIEEDNAAAIDDYLKSLKPVPSPYLVKGKLSGAAKRGKILFENAGCLRCHSGDMYTDLMKYDVGTGAGEEQNLQFDTPTLIEVWRTGPYLYNGSAATIMGVLKKYNPNDEHGITSNLSEKQLNDLAEYVLSL